MKTFMHIWPTMVASLVLLIGSGPLLAQRGLTEVPDPDPAKEQASFTVAEGFAVNLFAAEPMLAKPIQMNWDTQGRLWVATSETYPHIKPGEKANDKIVVLEDTDGDGAADRSTVFADGLLMPTAILPGDGGVYVGASTELLHLKDTDGDGKADETRVVLSGFGTEDTHHMIHTLKRGPAGDIYFNQSIYTHSHLETPFGVKRLLAGGTWQMNPKTIQLDVYSRGLVNPWGLVFNQWGQTFETDGAGSQGIHYVFPDVVMLTAYNAERIVTGLNPGQPKHCGLELLSGDHLPDGWAGRYVTNDFRGNRINSFELSASGSGYASVQSDNLLTSTYVSFRPIDILAGPDGAIYVADWYNPIIQHGEVDFRDDRRDKEHGRIWRIAPTQSASQQRVPPSEKTIPELFELLTDDEKWWRDAARTELASRDRDAVLPEALRWTAAHADAAGQPLLEGLWLLQNFEQLSQQLLDAGLSSADARVRAACVRIAAATLPPVDRFEILGRSIEDDHPQVQLEALHGLRDLATAEALAAATTAISASNDRFLEFSIWQTFRETESIWLPELKRDPQWGGLTTEQLIYVARAARSPEILTPIIAWWREGQLDDQVSGDLLTLVAQRGTAQQLDQLWDDVLQADSPRTPQILQAMVNAAQGRKIKPTKNLAQITTLIGSTESTRQLLATRLAGLWKVSSARADLRQLVSTETSPMSVRSAALQSIAQFAEPSDLELLNSIAVAEAFPELQLAAIDALASVRLNQAAQAAVKMMVSAPENLDVPQLLQPFLSRKQGGAALAKSLQNQTISPDIASLAVRQANAAAQKNPGLVKALQAAGQLDPIAKMMSAQQVKQLAAQVMSIGNADRGEQIYRRENLQCLKCHAIGGAGGKVGPDMTSIGASAPVDYLIESLFDPNKKIKEGYHTLQIVTADGLVKAGVPVLQNEQQVHLRDVNGNIEVISTDDIELSKMSPVSLMPADLVSKLPRNELLDLVRFLSALGKSGQRVVPKNRYVRTWQTLKPGDRRSAINDAIRHNGPQWAATDDPLLTWTTTYSLVSGELPLVPLAWMGNIDGRNLQFARFEINVVTAGKVGLAINNPTGLQMWIDDQPVEVDSIVKQELATGKHRVTIASDSRERRMQPLQIELINLPDSQAQAELVN